MSAALALAPEPVRERLRDAHPRPLVGVRKRNGQFCSGRVSPERAWSYPYVEIENAGSNFAALVFDCDEPAALGNLADLPPYSWIVRNESNGHAHVVWTLAAPIHRYPAARQAPLDYLRHVSEFLHDELDADPGYSHTLTANPAAPPEGRSTLWGSPRPYELHELAKIIPFNWKAPRVSQSGVGRNCDLYRDLMDWAGRRENASTAAHVAAHARNQEFDNPLPLSEVAAIARSVEQYRARWAARGWHDPRWIERQRARGRKGGRPRKYVKGEEPWTLECISRATWYRRQRQ